MAFQRNIFRKYVKENVICKYTMFEELSLYIAKRYTTFCFEEITLIFNFVTVLWLAQLQYWAFRTKKYPHEVYKTNVNALSHFKLCLIYHQIQLVLIQNSWILENFVLSEYRGIFNRFPADKASVYFSYEIRYNRNLCLTCISVISSNLRACRLPVQIQIY